MKRWLHEPLVHFLGLGALLFGVYAWLHRGESGNGDSGTGPVHITAKEIAFLTETWERQQQREPTREELHALVAGYLKEELLGREARTMGLDQNDLIIRRRLAQKVQFIVDDTSRLNPPSEDDLRRFYEANIDTFKTRARVSFTHVYFNSETRRDAAVDAKAGLVILARRPAATGGLGDPCPLDGEMRDEDMRAVAGQFGDAFANAVFALEAGAWHGPIASSFGMHLVRVTEAEPVRQLQFSEVEAQVREAWREEHQREANERYYTNLLKKYDVVVDENVKPLVGSLDGFAAQENATVAVVPK